MAAGCQQESDGEVVHVWEVSSGKKLGGFLAGAGRAKSVIFSPDGTVLAAGGVKGGVTLWSVPSGKLLRKLTVDADSVSFSPDGRTLATGDDDYVRFWDAQTGKELRLRTGHHGSVLGVIFAAGGDVLATASYDETIRLWDVKSRKDLRSITNACPSVWVSPDGRRLACAKRDGTVCLWDVPGDKEVREYRTGGDLIESFAISPDHKTLAVRTCLRAGGGKATIHLYDFTTGEKTRSFEDPSYRNPWDFPGGRLAFSPDGTILASADLSRMITSGRWRPERNFVNSAATRGPSTASPSPPPEGSLASGAGGLTVQEGSTFGRDPDTDTTIRFWDTSTGQQLLSIKNGEAPVYAVAFSRDGKLLAAGDNHGTISVRKVAPVKTAGYRNPGGQVYSLAFAPDGASLVSGMSDGTILQWDVAPPRYRPADEQGPRRVVGGPELC